MDFGYKQPKLKDKIYGQMYWDDIGDDTFWFARMIDESGSDFDVLIYAESPVDFLVVSRTHSTYKRLIENITDILDKTVDKILENSRELFKKQRQRKGTGNFIKKTLRLYSIKIYPDLSATVEFTEKISEDEDPEEIFFADFNGEGKFIDAGVSEF